MRKGKRERRNGEESGDERKGEQDEKRERVKGRKG